MLVLFGFMALLLVWQARACEPLVYRGSSVSADAVDKAVLFGGAQISQSINAAELQVQGLQIELYKSPTALGSVSVKLLGADSRMLLQQSVAQSSLFDTVPYTFAAVEPFAVQQGELLTLVISCDAPDAGSGLVVPTDADGNAAVNLCFVRSITPVNRLCAALLALLAVGFIVVLLISAFVKQPLKLFVLLYVFAGIAIMLALPPLDGPDEMSHYLRVLEISQGDLVTSDTPHMPSGFLPNYQNHQFVPWRYWLSDAAAKLDFSAPQGALYQNTSVYSPLVYLPQAAAAFLIRLITDNRLAIFYAIRLGNLLSNAAILYFAVKALPAGKYLMMTISFLPPLLQGAACASADGLTYSLCCAFFALLMQVCSDKKTLTKTQIVLLYAVPVLLCQCKIIYGALCILLFFIPVEKFGSKKSFWLHVAALGTLLIVCSFGWLAFASQYLQYPMNPGVDSGAQVAYILQNPVRFVWNCCKTFFADDGGYIEQMLGQYLGWLTVGLSRYLLCGFGLFIAAAFLFDPTHAKKQALPAWTLAGVSALVAALVFLAEYVQFTPLGSGTVWGVQGRYFAPVLFAALMALRPLVQDCCQPMKKPQLLLTGSTMFAVGAALYTFIQTW